MDEKEIVRLIKNKEYSRLAFLKDERLLQENEFYYGFLYFLADSQREDTADILVNIERKLGSRAKAYKYLGEIADKVSPNLDDRHISESFYRKSVGLDNSDSEAWWGLFCKTNDCNDFLNSLRLDYINKKYATINNNLSYGFVSYMNTDGFSTSDWGELEQIILDDNVSAQKSMAGRFLLISACYYLNRFEEGVKIISSVEKISIDILKKYYQLGLIDVDTALSKLFLFEVSDFLGDNHEGIYKEYLERSKSGSDSPTKSELIEKAFKARNYKDVVELYIDASRSESDTLFRYDLEPYLYYAIAQLYLGGEARTDKLSHASDNGGRIYNRNPGLEKAYTLKRNIFELENLLDKGEFKHHPISSVNVYRQAMALLDSPTLLNHYLYDQLYKELELLRHNWDEKHFGSILGSALEKCKVEGFSYDELLEYCSLKIHNQDYNDAVEKVEIFHRENPPTTKTLNILGVCFEQKGFFLDAFDKYSESIAIMDSNKDYDYVTINNYLECARKHSMGISREKYDYYRDKLNIGMIEEFTLHPFITVKRSVLFKYYPFNINTLDSLVNQYFYLPSRCQLNDPIELPELDGVGPDYLFDSNYRICSFSNNENSMLMWSHYTQNHQGIMVEYKFGGELPSGAGIGKVKYTNEIKRNKEKNEYVFNQFLLTKNHEWAYEEEVRLLSYKKDKLYYENYDYPEHDRSKINAQIVSITLGCQFDESKKPLIINLIKNANEQRKSHEPTISLRQAKISESNVFKLDYVNIEL